MTTEPPPDSKEALPQRQDFSWFARRPVGIKILIFVIVLGTLTQVISLTPTLVNSVNSYSQSVISYSQTQARLLAQNSAAGLMFDMKESVDTLLRPLQLSPMVMRAYVYRVDPASKQLALFAVYQKDKSQTDPQIESLPLNSTVSVASDTIDVFEPVILDGEVIGHVLLSMSLAERNQYVVRSVLLGLIVFVLSLLIAGYLSYRLHKSITRPIFELAHTAQRVADSNDYSIRADLLSADELGKLTLSFNGMLAALQRYDDIQQEKEQEIRHLNEDLENKVLNRTRDLAKTNLTLQDSLDKLRQTQHQLVEQEKMASLGSLVAGIAHEVNTPIGICVTANTHMEDTIRQTIKEFDENKLTRSGFQKALQHIQESAAITQNNLQRAASLVKSFKLVAVDQSSEEKRLFNLVEYVDNILLSLRPKLKKVPHTITIDMDRQLNLYSSPGAFSQIFTNLIMNSLTHAFAEQQQGNINIRAYQEQDQLVIVYSDDGQGIPADILPRLFEPFVTSKRGQGGSGLGAHIIYNLVTQVLGGQIVCDSVQGKGTIFTIRLPKSRIT